MSFTISKILPFFMGLFLGFYLSSFFKIEKLEDISRTFFYQCLVNTTGTSGLESGRSSTPKPGIAGYENVAEEILVNNSVAVKLGKQVRVICWVMTEPVNVTKKLEAVKKTWGKRCTKLLLFSSKDNNETGTIGLPNTEEGRDWLWAKTKEAFKYIYKHHLGEGEWFLKADDDTFVIMENLRYMLSSYDHMEPTYFGCRFKYMSDNQSQGYMSGGAGYVLSKESLMRFVEIAVDNPNLCEATHFGPEDFLIGKCLEQVGVKAMDTRDILKYHRFSPFNSEFQINLKRDDTDSEWYWNMIYYPQDVGLECCSNYTISFHYIAPEKMYELEFFIYHLKPFGISLTFNLPYGNRWIDYTTHHYN